MCDVKVQREIGRCEVVQVVAKQVDVGDQWVGED